MNALDAKQLAERPWLDPSAEPQVVIDAMDIVGGKMFGVFIVGLAQFAVLYAFTNAIGVRWGDPMAVGLVAVCGPAAAGDRAGAMDMLTRLRAENPGSSIVLHNLGAAMQASGDLESAMRLYQEARLWNREALGAALAHRHPAG